MEKIKRYWYAEKNNFGLNFTLDSIGWEVLRFESKQARDSYVAAHEYRQDTGNYVCRGIGYKRMRDQLGYGSIRWLDEGRGYETGFKA